MAKRRGRASASIALAVFACLAQLGCGRHHTTTREGSSRHDRRVLDVEIPGHKASDAFARDDPDGGELYYGDFVAACRAGASNPRVATRCAEMQESIEYHKTEMWRRWAANGEPRHHRGHVDGEPPLRAGDAEGLAARRCKSELQSSALDAAARAQCEERIRSIAISKKEERERYFVTELGKLDAELSAARDDVAAHRRCVRAETLRYGARNEGTNATANVRTRIEDRCLAARAGAERICDEHVRGLVADGNIDDAVATIGREPCSAVSHNAVARALVARGSPRDRTSACASIASLRRVQGRLLEPAIANDWNRLLGELEPICNPVVAAKPAPPPPHAAATPSSSSRSAAAPAPPPPSFDYGRPPAMLQPSAPYNSGGYTTPSTRRSDCGSFSASGQGSTMYQTGCR